MTDIAEERRAAFDRNGFLVLPGFVPVAACDALRRRAASHAGPAVTAANRSCQCSTGVTRSPLR